MVFKFLLFLCVCGLSSALQCFPSEALTKFEMKHFQGKWYDLNIISTWKSKSELPDDLRCSSHNFTQGYKKFRVTYDVYVGGEHKVYPQTLNMEDSTRAHLSSDIMDMNVVCTDYTNYAVIHSCLTQGNMALDLITVMGRRRDEYNRITSIYEVNQCLRMLGTGLVQGWRVDHANCYN